MAKYIRDDTKFGEINLKRYTQVSIKNSNDYDRQTFEILAGAF